MNIDQRLAAFLKLGKFLRAHLSGEKITGLEKFHDELTRITIENFQYNGWFTQKSMEMATVGIAEMLREEELITFSTRVKHVKSKLVAVIMAGNIPAVGFHDLLCVLLTGHSILMKNSSDDQLLIPFLCGLLIELESEFNDKIQYATGKLSAFDAVIATGNNTSAMHFEYYFKKYPHIIRKNRNSVAVLSGKETDTELENLGIDIFTYFGLGCRNVSKLYIPKNYSFENFFKAMYAFRDVAENKKYFNNYEYHRALFLLEKIEFLDNNFMIVRPSRQLGSSVSVIHTEEYQNLPELKEELQQQRDNIQCIVGNMKIEGMFPFGKSQYPKIDDFADGVDTISFLNGLG